MPTPTSVTVNPGSGGPAIAVDQQSAASPFGANTDMPVSEIVFSKDGVADSLPVTGANPLPVGGINPATGSALAASVVPAGGVNEQAVYDARAQAARDELRINVQAIVDALTTSILQVAATIAGRPQGQPDPQNLVGVQGAPNGTPVPAVIQGISGTKAQVSALNELRVRAESVQRFIDSFDPPALDTVNNWQTPVTSGGASAAWSAGNLALNSGTTPGAFAYIQSQPTFVPESPGYLQIFHTIGGGTDYPFGLNAYRFWGIGTIPPGGPTIALPVQDGMGFEITTAGRLNAVLYSFGSGKTFSVDITSLVTDANVHKFYQLFRGDQQFWSVDSEDAIVANQPTGAPGPLTNTLPLLMLVIAGPGIGTSLQLSDNGSWVGDTSTSQVSLVDFKYGYRGVTVKGPNAAPTTADGALVVAISPTTAIATTEFGAATSVPTQRAGKVVAVVDQEVSGQLSAVIAKLDAILWCLMQMGNVSPPATDPAFTLTQ